MTVDLRLLRYFLAVAAELHFGRAATRLHVSQSALSQQIRKLEASLGTELFVRDRRTVALSESGRRLVEPARQAVAASEEFVASVRRGGRGASRTLTVGFMVRWPDGVLARALRAFRARCPDVRVEVRQYDFRDSTVGLRSGETDVGLLHLPLSWPGAATVPLQHVPRAAMLPADHPLAALPEVGVADLVACGLPWAAPPPEADESWRRFWSAEDARVAGGVAGPVVLTHEALVDQVAAGELIGLTDGAVPVLRSDGVAVVPVHDLAPAVRAVAWRRLDEPTAGGTVRPEVQEMVRSVCDTAALLAAG